MTRAGVRAARYDRGYRAARAFSIAVGVAAVWVAVVAVVIVAGANLAAGRVTDVAWYDLVDVAWCSTDTATAAGCIAGLSVYVTMSIGLRRSLTRGRR